MGRNITASRYADVNLAETRARVKRETCRKGGRVKGSERKWWARQKQTICRVCAKMIENTDKRHCVLQGRRERHAKRENDVPES